MKQIGMIVLVALAFAACQKQAIERTDGTPASPAPSASAPPRTAASSTPAAPAPTAAAPPVPAATPRLELAPPGVFYLLAAARVETPDGIRGLPPGTGVKLVRDGVYLTPYGETSLDASLLTNNLARARQARDADRAAQGAAQAALQPRATPDTPEARAAAEKANAQAAASQQAAIDTIQRQKTETRLATMRQQENQLEAQLNQLREKSSKENFNKVMKGRNIASTTTQQITQAELQLANLQDAIVAAEREIRALQKK